MLPTNIGSKQMQNSEKILGIKIDSKSNFKDQRICTKCRCQIKCFDQNARLNEPL